MTIINDATGIRNLEITIETTPLAIEWNMDDALVWVEEYAERYVGVEVTEENLPQMIAAEKDLRHKIKRIDEIRLEQKKKQMAPYETFKIGLDKLVAALVKVCDPISAQTAVYSNNRRKQKRIEAEKMLAESIISFGLRPKFATQISIAESWTNLSATKSKVRGEIESKVSSMLQLQQAEDQAEEMKRQRREMAVTMCKMQSDAMKLASPVTPADIYGIDNLTLSDLPAAITTAVTRRKESEQAAIDREEKRKADDKKREEQQKIDEEASRIRQANIDAANLAIARVEQQKEAVEAAEELPFAPPAPPVEKQFRLDVSVFGTEAELTTFLAIIEANGYNCVMGEMKEVEGAA